jgi:hypothetical protein
MCLNHSNNPDIASATPIPTKAFFGILLSSPTGNLEILLMSAAERLPKPLRENTEVKSCVDSSSTLCKTFQEKHWRKIANIPERASI